MKDILGYAVLALMALDMLKFMYDTECSRKPVTVDGFEPVNRHIVDLALRQL